MKELNLSLILILFTYLLHAQAFEDVKEKAEQGDPVSQFRLGTPHDTGEKLGVHGENNCLNKE